MVRTSAAFGIVGTAGGIMGVMGTPLGAVNRAPYLTFSFLESNAVGEKYCTRFVPGLEIGEDEEQHPVPRLTQPFFTHRSRRSREPARGCLTVNWFRNTLSDGRMSGELQLTWALLKGDEGVLISEHMHRSGYSGGTQFDHEIFWLERSGGTWSVRDYAAVVWLLGTEKYRDNVLPESPEGDGLLDPNLFPNRKYWGFAVNEPAKLAAAVPLHPEDLRAAEGFRSRYEWAEERSGVGESFASWSRNLEPRWSYSIFEDLADGQMRLPEEMKSLRGRWIRLQEEYGEYSGRIRSAQESWGWERGRQYG